MPIVADESVFDHHDAFRVLAVDACDYVNLKLSKSGGIRAGQKVAAIVDARGQGVHDRLHDGVAARPHRRGASRVGDGPLPFFDLDSAHLLAADPILGGMRYEKDMVVLDERRGWGRKWIHNF